MNQLDQIENRIREIIEKGGNIFSLAENKPLLISHFCESLRRFLLENNNYYPNTPHTLHIIMSLEEFELWKYYPDWEKTLREAYLETVIELNCRPAILPEMQVTMRKSLQSNEIIFIIDENDAPEGQTGVVSFSKPLRIKPLDKKSFSGKILIDQKNEIPIQKSVINIGRKSNNDVVIDDMRVSRQHAQIRKTREGFMIFDLASTGGTFINSERITSRNLKSGDVISLAGYKLVFTDDLEQEIETDREITSDLSNQAKENNF